MQRNHHLVSLFDKVPVYCVSGSGLFPGQSKTQDLQMIEKVLFLL